MPGDYAAPCWLLRQARQLLYPRRCPFCRRVLGFVPTCPECAERLEPLRRMPMRLKEREHYLGTLSGAAAPYRYTGCVRSAVLRAKYQGEPWTAVELGVEMAKRYHEPPEVIHCIAAHHNDVEPQTVEAVLIQAADAISAARPGARRESIENYIRRLEKLEEISNSFPGVEKSFAIQSGREVRIMVKPEDISDEGTYVLAREVAKRIENELEYPGQIKVNVIRETRCTEFAK